MRNVRHTALMVALRMMGGMSPNANAFSVTRRERDDVPPLLPGGYGGDPINTGMRAEKDRIALEKAERKRARKAAKRARDMRSNAVVSSGPRHED
jgi:hypothetical protein